MLFLRTLSERSQQSFFPLFCFHLHWKILCLKPIQKYLYMLQSYSTVCYLANRDIKDPIVMQIRVIAKTALTGY